MANRHLSRSIVLQTLFEWDFNNEAVNASEVLERNAEEFAPGMGDISFIRGLGSGIIERHKEIDEIIVKAAPDWPLEKISMVDRNILRVGLYELLFSDRSQVPAKVAINESIELAKTFGGENSGKFVNGVLGAVYKEIGEPGKNEIGKRKGKEPVDLSKIPVEKLCGAVVYAKEEDEIYLGFVHDVFGRWTLSKGRVKEGESLHDGVIRKVKEEMGIDCVPEAELGSNEYIASHPELGKIRKQVVYFLAQANRDELVAEKTGGLDDARWFRLADILDLTMYEDILPLVTKAINILTGNDATTPEPEEVPTA
ncbi:MAG: transcription antitermination factor NusB [Candidatus Yonathbacteria bacterium RIFOXYC1_FULL_52_10]|uniref:Transcription antitermination protein NusB n=1 Tax=Candidatus Yonathbacteria bacterium RIFOXYD1_FULL_52_36 TaxID=1802730 RepID=A0A1G2SNC9_9BACT|nr:MAG: transcription antitermination factor NusB [Candidatus Yonathbacteria bacterium RIFOXYC1_FULL_52_10]OHA86312.1 MAG: transcription antitermination factor NusB [Candidatus Yonathbacteria bacterium RIFOXYD1_FULL_52_36]